MSFKTLQVVETQASETGSLLKKHRVNIHVKFQNGDEYFLMFLVQDETRSLEVKAWIDNLVKIGRTNDEVYRLLRTREKVALSEVCSILSKNGLSSTPSDGQRMVEGLISSGAIEGVFDGASFVSKMGMQRESVQYQVVTSFEMGRDGVVSLKCPSCGSPIQMLDKASVRKCGYCGTEFMVPKRILDTL